MSQASEAGAFYEAMNSRDPRALLAAMTEDFVGHVSVGMPLGVGGRHDGRQAMLTEVWGPVFEEFEVTLDIECLLQTTEGLVVAIGHYRGTDRASGELFEARFAHVLEIKDGLVSRLEQITDSRRWPSGVGGSAR